MPESTQHKLDRVRSPRVQITYDVETGGAIVKRELPLVVGIMAALSGQREAGEVDTTTGRAFVPKDLKDRKFVEIDRDNFDEVLEKSAPQLKYCMVPGADNAKKTKQTFQQPLTFRNLESFEPFEIVKQVTTLKNLFEARTRLADLVAKADGKPQLEAELRKAIALPGEGNADGKAPPPDKAGAGITSPGDPTSTEKGA